MASEEDEVKRIRAWVVAAIVGSTAVNQTIQQVLPVRYDAFTGSQGREISKRIDKIESELNSLSVEQYQYHYRDEQRVDMLVKEIAELRGKLRIKNESLQ